LWREKLHNKNILKIIRGQLVIVYFVCYYNLKVITLIFVAELSFIDSYNLCYSIFFIREIISSFINGLPLFHEKKNYNALILILLRLTYRRAIILL